MGILHQNNLERFLWRAKGNAIRTNGKVTGEGNKKKEKTEGQMDKETPMPIGQRQ